jgi:hypothetical protein
MKLVLQNHSYCDKKGDTKRKIVYIKCKYLQDGVKSPLFSGTDYFQIYMPINNIQ